MKSLSQCQHLIIEAIEEFTAENGKGELYEPINYIMNIGGKRMRPALLLMACDLFGGDVKKALKPALAIEVFHNFTLMHDDIMDEAPMRRGQKSVHKKWDTNAAILSGDAMMVQAYQLITETPDKQLKPVLEVFSDTAIAVCEGQQMDMDFENRDDVAIHEYLEMIRLKTSVLVAAALKIGAIIAGASKRDQEHAYFFGEKIGMAFQLRDDYLDVFGEEDKVGKQTGGDILSDKKTYLLLRARQKASPDQLKKLNELNGNNADQKGKVEKTIEIFRDLRVDHELIEKSEMYFAEAITHLNSIKIEEERKIELQLFAEKLMIRES